MIAKKRLPAALDFAHVQALRDVEAAKAKLDRATKNDGGPKIIAGLAAKLAKAAKALELAKKPRRTKPRK